MDVAVYCRISLDREGESESPERQEALCRQHVEARGWTVAEVFVDRDISAYKNVPRPALERLWKGIEDGRFGAVCVWKLDRLTRRFTDTGAILGRLETARAELVSVQESIDTATPMGKAIVGVLVAQAEQESRNTSQRVSAAWDALAAQGKPHPGGQRLYGYSREFEQIPEEVAITREVVTRLLDGQSLRSMADDLNGRHLPTSTGKSWSGHGLRQWLRSPALAGIRTHNGSQTRGTWYPIITTQQHEALLVVLGSVRPSGEPRAARWILTGLVRCGMCRERMYVLKGKHYGCQRRPENHGCGRVSISQQGLDAYVVEEVLSFLSAVDLRPTPGDLDPDALRRGVQEDDRRLKELNRARFVLGTISQEEWQPSRDELSARLDAGREALAAWERQQDGLLRPGNREDLDAWWEAATVEQRRGALAHTLVGIKIMPASRRGALFETRARRTVLELEDLDESLEAGRRHRHHTRMGSRMGRHDRRRAKCGGASRNATLSRRALNIPAPEEFDCLGYPSDQTVSGKPSRARTLGMSAVRAMLVRKSSSCTAVKPARSTSLFSLSTHSPAAAIRPWAVASTP